MLRGFCTTSISSIYLFIRFWAIGLEKNFQQEIIRGIAKQCKKVLMLRCIWADSSAGRAADS